MVPLNLVPNSEIRLYILQEGYIIDFRNYILFYWSMGAHEKFKDIKGSNQKPRIEGLTIQYNGKRKRTKR
jgi:hypothetical protein